MPDTLLFACLIEANSVYNVDFLFGILRQVHIDFMAEVLSKRLPESPVLQNIHKGFLDRVLVQQLLVAAKNFHYDLFVTHGVLILCSASHIRIMMPQNTGFVSD